MTNVRDLLPLHTLGLLEPNKAAAVEQALAADPALAAELAQLEDAAQLMIAPVTPSPDVAVRLRASIGDGPFERFAARMATLFDVTVDRARELLGLIERPASWTPELPGVALVHFSGGPAYAAADCGFIRLAPGAVFPAHRHLGEEASLVLQGSLRDGATGRILGVGDELVQATGSTHELRCEGSADCIFAARAIHGIEVGGAPARPPKPSL